MRLSDYVYGDDGLAVENATVEAWEYGGGAAVDSTTSAADGSWSLPSLPDGVLYRIKYSYGGQDRWIESDAYLQLTQIVGSDGTSAPLSAGSVTSTMLASGSVDAAKMANNAVSDAALGYRTIDDTNSPDLDTDTLTNHLSGLANQVKAITGEAGWKTAPADDLNSLDSRATTLESAVTAMQTTNSTDSAVHAGISTVETTLVSTPILAAGTWLVHAYGYVTPDSFNNLNFTITLYNGASALKATKGCTPANSSKFANVSLTGLITLASSATITLKIVGDDAGHSFTCPDGSFTVVCHRVV